MAYQEEYDILEDVPPAIAEKIEWDDTDDEITASLADDYEVLDDVPPEIAKSIEWERPWYKKAADTVSGLFSRDTTTTQPPDAGEMIYSPERQPVKPVALIQEKEPQTPLQTPETPLSVSAQVQPTNQPEAVQTTLQPERPPQANMVMPSTTSGTIPQEQAGQGNIELRAPRQPDLAGQYKFQPGPTTTSATPGMPQEKPQAPSSLPSTAPGKVPTTTIPPVDDVTLALETGMKKGEVKPAVPSTMTAGQAMGDVLGGAAQEYIYTPAAIGAQRAIPRTKEMIGQAIEAFGGNDKEFKPATMPQTPTGADVAFQFLQSPGINEAGKKLTKVAQQELENIIIPADIKDSLVKRGVMGGVESLGPMFAATIPSIITGMPMVSIPTTLALFGGAKYTERKNELLNKGVPQKEAENVAALNGIIEGGVESIFTPIELATLGLGKAPIKAAKSIVKERLKGILKAYGEEYAEEVIQGATDKIISQKYGTEPKQTFTQATKDIVVEPIIPVAVGMGALGAATTKIGTSEQLPSNIMPQEAQDAARLRENERQVLSGQPGKPEEARVNVEPVKTEADIAEGQRQSGGDLEQSVAAQGQPGNEIQRPAEVTPLVGTQEESPTTPVAEIPAAIPEGQFTIGAPVSYSRGNVTGVGTIEKIDTSGKTAWIKSTTGKTEKLVSLKNIRGIDSTEYELHRVRAAIPDSTKNPSDMTEDELLHQALADVYTTIVTTEGAGAGRIYHKDGTITGLKAGLPEIMITRASGKQEEASRIDINSAFSAFYDPKKKFTDNHSTIIRALLPEARKRADELLDEQKRYENPPAEEPAPVKEPDVIDTRHLEVGDTFTIYGEKFNVLPGKEPGEIRIKDGVTYDKLAMDDTIPVDGGLKGIQKGQAAREQAIDDSFEFSAAPEQAPLGVENEVRNTAVLDSKHTLQKPIKGKTGSEIIGYQWVSKLEDGMFGDRRVSAWEDAQISEPTGRQIVHLFWVRNPGGEVQIMGVNAAKNALGINTQRLYSIAKAEQSNQLRIKQFYDEESANIEKNGAGSPIEAAQNWRTINNPSKAHWGTLEERIKFYDEAFNKTTLLQKNGKYLRTGDNDLINNLKDRGWEEPPKQTPAQPPAENAPPQKQPWEMTREEFKNHKLPTPKDGNIIVYHALSNEESLPSVLTEGLLASKKKVGGEGPKGVLWGTTTPEGYSKNKTVIGFEIPKSDAGNIVAGNEYQIIRDIKPSEIVYVDRPSFSPVSVLGRISTERTSKYADAYHEEYVKQALSEGKFVPQAVLEEYADEPWAREALGKGEMPKQELSPILQQETQAQYEARVAKEQRDREARANYKKLPPQKDVTEMKGGLLNPLASGMEGIQKTIFGGIERGKITEQRSYDYDALHTVEVPYRVVVKGKKGYHEAMIPADEAIRDIDQTTEKYRKLYDCLGKLT